MIIVSENLYQDAISDEIFQRIVFNKTKEMFDLYALDANFLKIIIECNGCQRGFSLVRSCFKNFYGVYEEQTSDITFKNFVNITMEVG